MVATAGSAVPIRRLTLYKHGVAFVERRGAVTEDAVSLTVHADALNDALKSLLVHDHRGGQVLGLHYTTPVDVQARRADTIIDLSDDHSLLDLVRSLRGWGVRLVSGDGAQSQEVAGRLLGVDVANRPMPENPTLVALVDDAGAVRAVPLNDLRQIVVLDERAAQDLRVFLDASRRDDIQRTITLRLSPGDHDLAISYLVPSPTWRVSYRLIAESTPASDGADPATGASGGTLLLQGWALFDNRLEEDLEAVRVTLVAGQPVSFVYDLAASSIPRRTVVQDAARVAAGPVEFAAAVPMSAPAPRAAMHTTAPRRRSANGGEVDESAPQYMAAAATIEDMAAQAVAATGGELSELFAYQVTTPVTVQRGASALAPILSAQQPYRRELLFNERKLAGHPVAALRFSNDTGLVLERGPAVVLEDGAYRGEAMVPFTKAGSEVYLAFAVELGITVTITSGTSTETVGLRIAGALLELRQATVLRTTYRLESSLATAQSVTVEHPIWAEAVLIETPAPEARTAGVYRWSVACPPRSATTFVVAERRDTWQATQLLDLTYAVLERYLHMKWLDEATLARLDALLQEKASIAKNEQEMSELLAERAEIYAREEQLRQNMAALGATGDEGTLRAQVVGQLRASEERLNAVDARIAALKAESGRRQANIDAQLAAFSADETPASV